MDFSTSIAASSFRKVLKGFEIGGLPFADVQFHLMRLLAAGTPPDELQEVLRRCELITPLPAYAHADVLRVIEQAKEQAAALAAEQPPDIEIELDESASTLDFAAEMEMLRDALSVEQAKSHDMGRALAERIASEQSARARAEEARREVEQLHTELRGTRHSISDRDTVIAQMRISLNDSNAQLASAQKSDSEARASLDSRGKSAAQLQSELQSQLAAAKQSVEKLQREFQQSAAEHSTLREALASRDAKMPELMGIRKQVETLESELKASKGAAAQLREQRETAESQLRAVQVELKRALSERDTNVALLRENHERAATALEIRAKSSEVDLQSSRRRVDALERELGASRDEAGPLRAERDSVRSQLAALQSKLRDSESQIVTLHQSVRNDARRMAELQAASVPLHAVAPHPVAAPAATPVVPRTIQVEDVRQFPQGKPASRAKSMTRTRLAAGGAAIAVLAVMAWAYLRRDSVPAIVPPPAVTAPKAGTVLNDCPDCPAVTVLPTGRFEQGAAPAAADVGAFEKPAHAVAIAYPIAISTSPVTVDEFREFATATGRSMQGCDIYDGEWRHRADSSWEKPGFAQEGSHPVTCASWNDAKAYAAWLSAKTGHHYRLPSASEWEYAARGGATAVAPWTDATDACSGANVADQSAARRYPGWTTFSCDDSYVFTAPVGSFKANAFGLNDMLGNVFQWTEDCWTPNYAGAPSDGSARTDGDCSERELRGGSWFSTPAYVRANYRNHFATDYRTSSVGFRLVREIDT